MYEHENAWNHVKIFEIHENTRKNMEIHENIGKNIEKYMRILKLHLIALKCINSDKILPTS